MIFDPLVTQLPLPLEIYPAGHKQSYEPVE